MSFNSNDTGRSARRHRPALIAIAVAILVSVLAFLVFRPGVEKSDDGVTQTPPPAGVPLTDAEGRDGAAAPQIAPEGLPQPQTPPARTEAPANP